MPDKIIIEVDSSQRGGRIEKTSLSTTVLNTVDGAVTKAAALLASMAEELGKARETMVANKPTEMELTFGLKVTTEGTVFVAKTAAEAQIEVKYIWK